MGAGMNPNMRAFTRIVICGACAALAKMFRASPMRCGAGSVRWKHFPHALEQLEEVVGSVDLVDEAGLRMPDHETWPVDAPRPRAFRAHDALRHVLGLEIRM